RATEHRLFVERVQRIEKRRWAIATRLGLVQVRMEYEMRAVTRRPAYRLRIAPALVTDRDPECERAGAEHAALVARRIDAVLGGIQLHLVLVAGDAAVGV